MSEPDTYALLAHDLRSPLAIVKGGLVQLLTRTDRHGPLSDRQRGILNIALRSAQLLEDLLDEVVLTQLLTSDEGGPPSRATSLREVLVTAIPDVLQRADDRPEDTRGGEEILERRLDRRGIALEAAGGVLEMPLWILGRALVRVVMNLVGNALNHAPGPLTIRAHRRGDDLELAFVDCGPGLPEQVKRALADSPPGDVAPATSARPSGLGLVSTRWLIERLGGALRAEAGLGGKGTAMIVTVPRAFGAAGGP